MTSGFWRHLFFVHLSCELWTLTIHSNSHMNSVQIFHSHFQFGGFLFAWPWSLSWFGTATLSLPIILNTKSWGDDLWNCVYWTYWQKWNLRLKFVVSMVSRTSLYEVIPINHIVFISGDIPLGKKTRKQRPLEFLVTYMETSWNLNIWKGFTTMNIKKTRVTLNILIFFPFPTAKTPVVTRPFS